MFLIPFILIIIVWSILVIKFKGEVRLGLIMCAISLFITLLTVGIDYIVQTTDIEVWSGRVVNWEHKEERDEWHPPRTETYTTTDSKGKITTHTRTIPGYWEHHYAQNHIKTTDLGWFSVNTAPNGRIMNDAWPNTTQELKQLWPENTPSASSHSYKNKIQASYSIYRHKDIDLRKYHDLPQYPSSVRDYIYIDRVIGEVPNKQEALKKLADWNAELNKMVIDPEKPGKKRSWKQVNIIFANVGDKPEDYGFALQDKWEGGNKNDFVVVFSMDSQNNLKWVYPFSWADGESSENLKIEVRDYMMNDVKTITDFVPIVDEVSKLVADKFVRKQFADFNYLQIELSKAATICIWVFNAVILIVSVFTVIDLDKQKFFFRKYFHKV